MFVYIAVMKEFTVIFFDEFIFLLDPINVLWEKNHTLVYNEPKNRLLHSKVIM